MSSIWRAKARTPSDARIKPFVIRKKVDPPAAAVDSSASASSSSTMIITPPPHDSAAFQAPDTPSNFIVRAEKVNKYNCGLLDIEATSYAWDVVENEGEALKMVMAANNGHTWAEAYKEETQLSTHQRFHCLWPKKYGMHRAPVDADVKRVNATFRLSASNMNPMDLWRWQQTSKGDEAGNLPLSLYLSSEAFEVQMASAFGGLKKDEGIHANLLSARVMTAQNTTEMEWVAKLNATCAHGGDRTTYSTAVGIGGSHHFKHEIMAQIPAGHRQLAPINKCDCESKNTCIHCDIFRMPKETRFNSPDARRWLSLDFHLLEEEIKAATESMPIIVETPASSSSSSTQEVKTADYVVWDVENSELSGQKPETLIGYMIVTHAHLIREAGALLGHKDTVQPVRIETQMGDAPASVLPENDQHKKWCVPLVVFKKAVEMLAAHLKLDLCGVNLSAPLELTLDPIDGWKDFVAASALTNVNQHIVHLEVNVELVIVLSGTRGISAAMRDKLDKTRKALSDTREQFRRFRRDVNNQKNELLRRQLANSSSSS